MPSASRGEMPKNPASKSAMASRKPPRRAMSSPSEAVTQPRSVGKAPTASVPSRTSRHRSSGSRTPPGKRQAMPTMTTGSSTAARRRTTTRSAPPSSSSRRYATTAAGVGWSKTSVLGSTSSVSCASMSRIRTELSESMPSSAKAWSASIAERSRWPSAAAVAERTRSSRRWLSSSGASPASGCAGRPAWRGAAASTTG